MKCFSLLYKCITLKAWLKAIVSAYQVFLVCLNEQINEWLVQEHTSGKCSKNLWNPGCYNFKHSICFFFHYTSLKRYPPSKKTLDSILSYLEAIHFSIPMVSSSKKENIQNDLIENKSRTQLSDSTELKH